MEIITIIQFTFVNKRGPTVFTWNVSNICSAFTMFIRVDLGAQPALLNKTFSPSSFTIPSTSWAKLLKDSVCRTSEKLLT